MVADKNVIGIDSALIDHPNAIVNGIAGAYLSRLARSQNLDQSQVEGSYKTCVNGRNGVAAHHREDRRHACHGRVGIVVQSGVSALIDECRCKARRCGESDFVLARRKVSKHVHAGSIGNRGEVHRIAGAVKTLQHDYHAGHYRFVGVLNAVKILIFPHKVPYFSRNIVPCVKCRNRVAALEGKHRSHPHVGGVGITVLRVIISFVGMRQHQGASGRCAESDFVLAGYQVSKHIHARCVGLYSNIDRIALAVCAGEGYVSILNTRFVGVLNAVSVEVFPNEITDFSPDEKAGIECRIMVAAL